jgi:hypothetical protein
VVLHFAQSVANGRGATVGVLLAAFDLQHFGTLFERVALPAGSVFTLTDAKGMRLTRFPETEKYTWVPYLPRMVARMSGPKDEGAFRESGVDGVLRLYAYTRLHFEGAPFPYLMIRLGVPVDEALAQARGVVRRNLLLLGLAAGLCMAAAWTLARWPLCGGSRNWWPRRPACGRATCPPAPDWTGGATRSVGWPGLRRHGPGAAGTRARARRL